MLKEAYALFGALGSGIGHLAWRLSGHDGIVCEENSHRSNEDQLISEAHYWRKQHGYLTN